MGNAILRRSKRACSLCNAIGEHSFEDGNIIIEEYPTCATYGLGKGECSRCKEFTTIYLKYDSNNHPEEALSEITILDGTCCTPGRLGTYCNSCKLYVDFYDGDLDPSNHEGPITTEQETPGTCTTPAKIVDYCFSCGATWNERDGDIDSTNHTQEIAYDDQGEPYYRCSECGVFLGYLD